MLALLLVLAGIILIILAAVSVIDLLIGLVIGGILVVIGIAFYWGPWPRRTR